MAQPHPSKKEKEEGKERGKGGGEREGEDGEITYRHRASNQAHTVAVGNHR